MDPLRDLFLSNKENRKDSSNSQLLDFIQSIPSKKQKGTKTPSIEDVERNILSEYELPLGKRTSTRQFSGLLGSVLSLAFYAAVIAPKIRLGYDSQSGLIGPAASWLLRGTLASASIGLGYLIGHQIGATYINTRYRRKKRPIVVGYDKEGKPITVEVFAPDDLKSRPFYQTMLGGI